jgi:hypothetical protein
MGNIIEEKQGEGDTTERKSYENRLSSNELVHCTVYRNAYVVTSKFLVHIYMCFNRNFRWFFPNISLEL